MAKSKRLWAIAALAVMVTGFTACLKDDNTTPSRPVAAFAFINGVTASTNVDFFDNTLTVKAGIALGFGGINYQAYGGSHAFSVRKAGTSTDLATSTLTYDSLNYYTLVAYGDSSSATIRSFKDDFTTASTSALNLRFFNLSPNIGAVDLYINGTKVDSNLTYVGDNGFNPAFKPNTKVTSGTQVSVKLAGTDTEIAKNTSSITLSTGYIYTIYLTGVKDIASGALMPKVGYVQSFY